MIKYVNESLLNEELIGTIIPKYYKKEIEIYKNPPSIKRMTPYSRAVSDRFGNLYIADGYEVIHVDLLLFLIKNNFISISDQRDLFKHFDPEDFDEDTLDYQNTDNILCWIRDNKNNFYLGESYAEYEKDILYKKTKKLTDIVSKKHPQYNFIQKKNYEVININF